MTLRRESTGPAGFEPATTSLTVRRSTTELQTKENRERNQPWKSLGDSHESFMLWSRYKPTKVKTGTDGNEGT